MPSSRSYVLGAGVTGLAAGLASGFPIIESSSFAGGICRSYERPVSAAPARRMQFDSYRFEIGGGHWIHTRYPAIAEFLWLMSPLELYERRAAVYLPELDTYIPYPLQDHAHLLPDRIAVDVRAELDTARPLRGPTMRDWCEQRFGPTLCGMFFHPFHERYTAGLYASITPQDPYKTPLPGVPSDGASSRTGYNATFAYPRHGFNPMIEQWAQGVAIEFGNTVTGIDTTRNRLAMTLGERVYDALISTLPLHTVQRLARVRTAQQPDPYSSALVINIGGIRGARCPAYHWIYFPASASGFHRVGVYSNVSRSFLPALRDGSERASFYVECAYPSGAPPSQVAIETQCACVVEELRGMGYIEEVDVLDPTWVEVAYCWRRPGSTWVEEVREELRRVRIHQVGRYATWQGYGIADSIRDGFLAGRAFSDPERDPDSDAFRALVRLET
jgi:protoporphyrinogen oxidase